MTKTPIRNLHSDKQVPPRFCDVVIGYKNKYEKTPWEDVVYQVEVAKASNQ